MFISFHHYDVLHRSKTFILDHLVEFDSFQIAKDYNSRFNDKYKVSIIGMSTINGILFLV